MVLASALAAAISVTDVDPALAAPGSGAPAPAGEAAPKPSAASDATPSKKERSKATPSKKKRKARRDRGAEKKAEKPAEKAEKPAEKAEKPAEKADKSAEKAEKPAETAEKADAKPADAPRKASGGKAEPKSKKGKKKVAARTSRGTRREGKAQKAPPKPCVGPTLQIDRGGLEVERIMLVDCKQRPRDEARKQLSILARPWGTPRPSALADATPASPAAKKGQAAKKGPAVTGEVAPGVRLVDPGLLVRLDALARRYPDKPISLVSGYRPQSRGSLHQSARALDLRILGVPNHELVAACRALPDTGCGYYPNSSFIHLDVRTPGTGTVSWIDASGPGEPPRYVSAWPPPAEEAPVQKEAPRAQKGEGDKDVQMGQRDVQMGQRGVQMGQRDVQMSPEDVQMSPEDVQMGEGDVQMGHANAQPDP